MSRLTRNAARCLHCGDVIQSRRTRDYVSCNCGNIAVDGGSSFARLAGQGLSDASYEPLHQYEDGRVTAGYQFIPFLNGVIWWGGGDGWALHRLLAALMTGVTLPLDEISTAGQRRLGYLAEIVMTTSPEPAAERKLLELVVALRRRLRSEPIVGDAINQLWLPARIAGPDEKATDWGLETGLSEWFRRALRTRID